MSVFELSGRKALVTGGAQGLGEGMARALADAGATVVIADLQEEAGRAVAKGLGEEHGFVALDVTSDDGWEKAVGEAVEHLGGLDILVNNAGIEITSLFTEIQADQVRKMLDVNFLGTALGIKHGLRAMRPGGSAGNGGSIINIASVLGMRVATNLLAYATAKAAVIQMTEALALEWARHGIRVNAIAPGYIETEMNRGFFQTEAGQSMVKRVPQRRIGTPSVLDGALLLLASGASSYMTGSTVVVDGGHVVNSL